MHQCVNWWAAVSAISAAITAGFVFATFWVYRQIRDIMEKANYITRQNLQDQYAPLVWIEKESTSTTSTATTASWKLVNIGRGAALQVLVKDWTGPSEVTIGQDQGWHVEVGARLNNALRTEYPGKPTLFALEARYLDAFGNKWISSFEGTRCIGARKVDWFPEGKSS